MNWKLWVFEVHKIYEKRSPKLICIALMKIFSRTCFSICVSITVREADAKQFFIKYEGGTSLSFRLARWMPVTGPTFFFTWNTKKRTENKIDCDKAVEKAPTRTSRWKNERKIMKKNRESRRLYKIITVVVPRRDRGKNAKKYIGNEKWKKRRRRMEEDGPRIGEDIFSREVRISNPS